MKPETKRPALASLVVQSLWAVAALLAPLRHILAQQADFTVVEGAGGMMADWQGNPLDAGSDGTVIALGDPARLEDVLEAMG